MTILWLQLLLNIVFCYWLVVSLRNKIKLSQLNEKIFNLDLYLRETGMANSQRLAQKMTVVESGNTSDEAPMEPSLKQEIILNSTAIGQVSTLSERKLARSHNYLDEYADAAQRFARGDNLKAIAQATGLSLSELRLVEKITRSTSEKTNT